MAFTSDQIYQWLEEVKDPEIPVLSLVDLGVITAVVIDNDSVAIEMTPTFVGCPALDLMQQEIKSTLTSKGVSSVTTTVNFHQHWTSDNISEKGRQALKQFGLAPPQPAIFPDIDLLEHVACPRCNSTDTELKNIFGPTLCRSIHYCNTCSEAFEQFKPIH
ncbi:MAG TPA: 1,2-phenylacetyl-CoA epoxidase subunit PaaD [Ohtaekwangia sp.]|uniref:1,2-phenylacetyl-CoA epoxidase subunit PaaD n=1 Tax=Ohtaekwangia sp. TaxID=2066019 RepID=UPI002F92E9C4